MIEAVTGGLEERVYDYQLVIKPIKGQGRTIMRVMTYGSISLRSEFLSSVVSGRINFNSRDGVVRSLPCAH